MSKSNVDTLEIQRLAYENAALKATIKTLTDAVQSELGIVGTSEDPNYKVALIVAELEARNALLKEAREWIDAVHNSNNSKSVDLLSRIDAALKGDSHE